MGKSLLNSPIISGLIKSYLPSIIENLGEAEKALDEYIKSFPLEGDETEIMMFTQNADGKLFLCIGAFTGNTFTRLIKSTPAREFIKEILTQK